MFVTGLMQFCYKPKFDWCSSVTNTNLTGAVLLQTQIWLVQSCYKPKFDWCSSVTNTNLTGAVLLQTQIWLVQFCYKTCLKYPIWSFKHILLQIHHFITKILKRLWKENLNVLTHLTVNFFISVGENLGWPVYFCRQVNRKLPP